MRLDSVGIAAAGIRVAEAVPAGAGAHVATGTVAYNQNAVSLVAPRAEGRVMRVLRDLGQRVRRGEPLALLESPQVGSLRGERARAQADVEVSRAAYERERALFEQKVSSRREMLEAEAEHRRAVADLEAAEASLAALGADGSRDGAAFAVSSPIDGTVVQRAVTPGQVAGPADTLFTVADLDRLWVELDVYEQDLGRVAAGQTIELATTAFPDSAFQGRLAYVGQVVDPRTRTVKARAEVPNPGLLLRPGMFVTARIHKEAPERATAAVSEASIQQIAGRSVVFVPLGAGRFQVQPVGVGDRLADGTIEVTAGLRPGQPVVANGAFYLKSELEKESFGGDSH